MQVDQGERVIPLAFKNHDWNYTKQAEDV